MTDTTSTTRTEAAVTWAVWHAGELTGITDPAVLAATWSPWWALMSGTVATVWAAREITAWRHRREITAALPPGTAARITTTSNSSTPSGMDGSEESA